MTNNSNTIFVFGSNLAGRHGAGSALHAKRAYGAQYGVGIGRTGRAYAIPTKDEKLNTLPIKIIRDYVALFLMYARKHPQFDFQIVAIGCGLAGYKPEDLAESFRDAPSNCILPKEFRDVLESQSKTKP